MPDPSLIVSGLVVRAGRRRIVDDVSLTAHAGEVTAVIGPNGAGKTSLLEAVVGIRPATGSISRQGKALTTFGLRARTFAYLQDQSEPAVECDVRTLVDHALACGAGRLDDTKLRRLLSLEPLLPLGAGALSRGERQRLGLFSTLVLGRPVVILDEPFSAFDPLQRRDVQSAVRLVAEAGATVIASIHQINDAEKIADRVLLLAAGRAVAFGSVSEVKAEAGGASTLEEAFVALLRRGP